MIKVVQTHANPEETLRRLVHAANFSEENRGFVAIGAVVTVTFVGGAQAFGGCTVDRRVFRKLLPDDRWYIYAAGIVNPTDANGVTIDLEYIPGSSGAAIGAALLLGTATYVGAGAIKQTLGPFDLYATASKADDTPVIRLKATKLVGATCTLSNWNVWVRFLPSKQ